MSQQRKFEDIIKDEFFTEITRKKGEDTEYKKYLENLTKIESLYDTSLLEADYDTARAMIIEMMDGSIWHNKNMLSKTRQYIKWCVDQGYSSNISNVLDNMDASGITQEVVKIRYLKDYNELIEFLDIVLKPVQDDTLDNMYRIAYQLLYFGLTVEDAIDLKFDDVDCSAAVITVRNEKIHVSNELLNLIKYDRDTDSYNVVRSGKVWQRPKDSAEYVLSQCQTNKPKNRQSMRTYMVQRLCQNKNLVTGKSKDLTLDRIYISGAMNMALGSSEDESAQIEFLKRKYSCIRKTITKASEKNIIDIYTVWKQTYCR